MLKSTIAAAVAALVLSACGAATGAEALNPDDLQKAIKAGQDAAAAEQQKSHLPAPGPGWPPGIKSAQAVLTTRNEGLGLTDSGVNQDGDRASIMVQIEGDLVWNGPHPRGAFPTTGSFAILMVDRASGLVTDTAISTRPVDLASLGPVADLIEVTVTGST